MFVLFLLLSGTFLLLLTYTSGPSHVAKYLAPDSNISDRTLRKFEFVYNIAFISALSFLSLAILLWFTKDRLKKISSGVLSVISKTFLVGVLTVILLTTGFVLGGVYTDTYQFFIKLDRDLVRNVLTFKDDNKAPDGKWKKIDVPDKNTATEQMKALKGLGYMAGVEEPSDLKGVVLNKQSSVQTGLNFYVSAHGPEAVLMDTAGRVMHKWNFPRNKAFPDVEVDDNPGGFFRKAELNADGSVIAIYDDGGIIKIDEHSNLIWSRAIPSHHDLWVENGDTIFAITRRAIDKPSINSSEKVIDERITVLTKEGETVERLSVLEGLLNSKHAPVIQYMQRSGDLLHCNSVQVLRNGERLPQTFNSDYALLSCKTPSLILLINMKTGVVEWTQLGLSNLQHDADLLKNGNLMYFSNKTNFFLEGEETWSRVMEIQPFTQNLVWDYKGNNANGFYSQCCGANQRLPNGNTLITESKDGRVFEVTADNEIVWDFYSVHRAGEDDQYVARLFEMERYPREYFESWLPHIDQ